MGKKLFVGNLPFHATDNDLWSAFGEFGTVTYAKINIDRETNRSKGFGFVEMSTDAEAATVITQCNGADMEGRKITVNEARPMPPRGTPRPVREPRTAAYTPRPEQVTEAPPAYQQDTSRGKDSRDKNRRDNRWS